MNIAIKIFKTVKAIATVAILLISSQSYSFSKWSDVVLEFDVSISEDATPALLKGILEAKDTGISAINFEKGTYHFYPDKGFEKYCYISNHGDLMVNTAFPILNMKDLTINGRGSTFVFHGVMIPFLIEDSKDITVQNITIDWNQTFHSEGLIVANDVINKTFDMKITDQYPYEIRNGEIFFIKEYYQHSMGQTILYDPTRKAISYNTEAYTGITIKSRNTLSNNLENIIYKYDHDAKDVEFKPIGFQNKVRVEQLKPGLIRVYGHSKKMPPVGHILTMKGEQGINRVAPAFRVLNTDGFNAKNINIHHAGGMGIIAENSSDLILERFNVTPSKGRMVSTTADATHFVGCRGKVVLSHCTFQNQLDDATNVHGTYQKIVDVIDEYTIGVRMMHHQQKGFVIGKHNDRIGLIRLANSFFPYAELSIDKVSYFNNRYQIVKLNQKIPKNIKVGDLIENLDAYPEVHITNCTISNNRARGLLISNSVKTIIENNFFSTEMEAILIPVESGYWHESGNGANIIIRNNTFQDCQHSGFNRGIIRLETDDDNTNVAFKNIKIINNTFNHFDSAILEVSNTDGLTFKGNKIFDSGTFPKLHPNTPVIQIKNSLNINFNNNSYEGKAKNKLKSDTKLKIDF